MCCARHVAPPVLSTQPRCRTAVQAAKMGCAPSTNTGLVLSEVSKPLRTDEKVPPDLPTHHNKVETVPSTSRFDVSSGASSDDLPCRVCVVPPSPAPKIQFREIRCSISDGCSAARPDLHSCPRQMPLFSTACSFLIVPC